MKNVRVVPTKNYLILALILSITVFFIIYLFIWYRNYEKDKLCTPIMDEYLPVIHYNELDNYLVENKDAIVYVSVLNDEQIRNFEKKFKRFVNKYLLNNEILYLDITNELNDNKLYNQISEKYSVNVPYVVCIDNGNVVSMFNIKDNNYDISLLKNYFISEGVIND